MKKEEIIINLGKKTIKAMENSYSSVISTDTTAFEKASNLVLDGKDAYFTGVKNTSVIDTTILEKLENAGFILHTKDVMSEKGRAICHKLINPLTLKPMTGSSSGTAINVFLGINDLGVGTDGGGSVLCPALALNLYGFISKLIDVPKKFEKKSTDNITFTPSVGFISSEIEIIKKAASSQIGDIADADQTIRIAVPKKNNIKTPSGLDVNEVILSSIKASDDIIIQEIEFPDVYADRQRNIAFLEKTLTQYDLVLSYEGPIDYFGFGDSLFGTFDDVSANIQHNSGKGLTRIINMVGGSGLVIPHNRFSSGFVMISKSTRESVANLFRLSNSLPEYKSTELMKRYFKN